MKIFKNGQQFISEVTGVKFTKKEIYDYIDDEHKKDMIVQKWQTVNNAVVLKKISNLCQESMKDINVVGQLVALRMQNRTEVINQNAYEVAKMVKLLLHKFDNEDVDTYEDEYIYSFQWITGILLMVCTILADAPQSRTDLKLMCNLKGFCEHHLGYKPSYDFNSGFAYAKEEDWEIYKINFVASFVGDEQYEELIQMKLGKKDCA